MFTFSSTFSKGIPQLITRSGNMTLRSPPLENKSRYVPSFVVEAIYMSGELWAEMSAKEDAKVKALKLKYKQRMTEAKVSYVVNVDI